jgi:hypothetical protein
MLKYLKARLESLWISDSAFVDQAFRDILGRNADQGGLEFYRGVLRQGVRRTAVLLDIMRSDEFRRSLAPSAHAASLPNLVAQRPDRYRRTTDRVNGSSMLIFTVESRDDFDWLERQILDHGYYEQPGVWVLDVDFDKRLVAEMLAAFAPSAPLEMGCASGAVLQCLDEQGITGEGLEISSMAIAKAADGVRPRIHQGDLLSLALQKRYDLLFGLDVFEHLNPNKLDAYVHRIADVTTDEAYVFCNIPAFGRDPVFGTVFPFYVEGWSEDAAAGRPLSSIHVDELGYPIHGHLAWGDAAWWTRQFEKAGFTRDEEIERAFHRKYGAYLEKRSPARRAFFVFGKERSSRRRADVLQRISAPSRLI